MSRKSQQVHRRAEHAPPARTSFLGSMGKNNLSYNYNNLCSEI